MKKENQETTQKISLDEVSTKTVCVELESIKGSSLITHKLNANTVSSFMARETGQTKKKELRDFDAEYESCFYYDTDGKYGFPTSGFMASILDAATTLTIPKTTIKRSIRLLGDITTLNYTKLNRRIDNPRRSGINKTPDTRHRPEFIDWNCKIWVQFNPNLISLDQIINLFNHAGFSSGIGDWRPSSPKSSGTHGMYRVKVTK